MAESQHTPETPEVSVPETPIEAEHTPAPVLHEAQQVPVTPEPAVIAEAESLDVPDGFKLMDAAKLAAMEDEIAEFRAFRQAREKEQAEQFADELVAASKIVEDKRDNFVARYLQDPQGTRDLADMLGAAPTGPQGSLLAASAAPHTPQVDYADPSAELPEQFQNQIVANRRRRAAN